MTGALSQAKRTAARGFTLIEALMAIFILAIGFLSLAAIFPAGIELQRRGSDDLEGVTAANDIFGELMSNPLLASDRLNEGFSSMIRETDPADAWMPDYTTMANKPNDPVRGYRDKGWLIFTVLVEPTNPLVVASSTTVTPTYVFYQTDRLWPSMSDPRLIWDVLVRRPDSELPATLTDAAQHMAGDVQIALILRRVENEFIRVLSETENVDPKEPPRPAITLHEGSSLSYESPKMSDLTNLIAYDEDAPDGQRFEWVGGTSGEAGKMLNDLWEPRQWLLDSDGNAWKIARMRYIDSRIYMEFAPEPTRAQAERFNDAAPDALTFVYCTTPPVLIDVRTFKSGAGL
ncbi:MAG: prepilin-type N-terminal cleavage/methylation domain-containing protein [Phycisphaerales bacterium JB038]